MVVKGLFEANGLGFLAIRIPASRPVRHNGIGAREATWYTKISNAKYNSI
jgi:hypothetical protein